MRREIILHRSLPQTKPFFIIRRFKGILYASLAIEIVSFIVTLTDAIVAGNMIDRDAMAVIGLMSPFQAAAMFFTAVINSGTLLNYTRAVGGFDRRRANEVFSRGCILALGLGIMFAVFLLAVKGIFIGSTIMSDLMRDYLDSYYVVILWYYLFLPLNTVIDNTVMNDGGEKMSSLVNILQIVGNVVLSIVLSRSHGVKGIAVASVLCQLAAMCLDIIWLIVKKASARFVLSFDLQSFRLLKDGLGRSTIYAMSAVMIYILNLYVNNHFGTDTTAVFVVVRKTAELSLIFMGLSLALQPFIGMLRGEGNTKTERQLMQAAGRIMLIIGLVTGMGMIIFAPQFVAAFGFEADSLGLSAVTGVRIVASTLFVRSLLMLFFVYYYLTGRYGPMLLITILGDLVSPLVLGICGSLITGSPKGLWVGIALSPVFTISVYAMIVLIWYGSERFPYLLPLKNEDDIFIYDFGLSVKNCIAVVETVGSVLSERGYPAEKARFVELVIEESLMLIREKNPGEKDGLSAECALILEDKGIRVILRDSGKVFNPTDTEAYIRTFRQYIVSQILTVIPDRKQYIASSGYNRCEFFFEKENADMKR